MEHEKTSIDTMQALVSSLRTAQPPETRWIYAIIRTMVCNIQSDLRIGEGMSASAYSARLDHFLTECRAAVFGLSVDSIARASDCLAMLDTIE